MPYTEAGPFLLHGGSLAPHKERPVAPSERRQHGISTEEWEEDEITGTWETAWVYSTCRGVRPWERALGTAPGGDAVSLMGSALGCPG